MDVPKNKLKNGDVALRNIFSYVYVNEGKREPTRKIKIIND